MTQSYRKITKKRYRCKGWFIPNTYTFLQHGNEPTMVANIITNEVDIKEVPRLDDKEESKVPKTTYLEDIRMDSEEEHKATKPTTPRSQMGSNNVNNTPKKYGYV